MTRDVWGVIGQAREVHLREVPPLSPDYARALVDVCGPDPAIASFLFTSDMPDDVLGRLVNRMRAMGKVVKVIGVLRRRQLDTRGEM